eukprot:SAG31_NODE_272_length_18690_cov_14.520785_19_plen_92_part_00
MLLHDILIGAAEQRKQEAAARVAKGLELRQEIRKQAEKVLAEEAQRKAKEQENRVQKAKLDALSKQRRAVRIQQQLDAAGKKLLSRFCAHY